MEIFKLFFSHQIILNLKSHMVWQATMIVCDAVDNPQICRDQNVSVIHWKNVQ